ncbi:radical SAM protein [bacterium]|nr:radical SAM protein [candidate division CSSED10-310 bacterium]
MSSLRVVEIFTSIQGESSFMGLPFQFVRLSGCNLRCTWCDTPESYTGPETHMTVEEILCILNSVSLNHVCVTGGEPLLQRACINLLDSLVGCGFTVTLETNGSLDISPVPECVHRIMDIKCPSSGMAASFCMDNLSCLTSRDEIKFVIGDAGDYAYARQFFLDHLSAFTGPVFVSPVLNLIDPEHLAKWVLCDKLPLRIQVQLHKLIRCK